SGRAWRRDRLGKATGRRGHLGSHELALGRPRRLERLETLGRPRALGWSGRRERLATTQRFLAVRISLLLRFAHPRRRRLLSLRLALPKRLLAAMAVAARRIRVRSVTGCVRLRTVTS